MLPFESGARGLRFRLFGTPITLDWTFLLIIALLGFSGARPWRYSLLFAAVAFVSILFHELGHALALRASGRRSRIIVHGFGGLTISEETAPLRDAASIAVSLAGPMAGVALGVGALALRQQGWGNGNLALDTLLSDLVLVNLGWGLINLLPILPLDGGHVMERLVNRGWPNLRSTLPYAISIAAAVPAAIAGWRWGYVFAAVIAVVFAALNVRMMTDHRREDDREAMRADAERALALLASSHPGAAIGALEAVLAKNPPAGVHEQVAAGLAWALAWRGAPGDDARVDAMVRVLAGRSDTALLAAWVARRAGRADEAMALLVRGLCHERTDPPVWMLQQLLPDSAWVDHAARWIDQQDVAARHVGLGRLASFLERAGRPADAASVRRRRARPLA